MESLAWLGGRLRILDQTRLPREEVTLDLNTVGAVAEAIRSLRVRGAPAIGVAAAYGVVLAALDAETQEVRAFLARLDAAIAELAATRPTAVNLFWALERMRRAAHGRAEAGADVAALRAALVQEAQAIQAEDEECCRRIGRYGAALLADGARVLTHCNAGALATAGIGTALAPIRVAVGQGKRVVVYADETRPLLQGARLTAWELARDGIPVTVLADSMAGTLMARRMVDCVIVGADRIAANGDVANKIGTYPLAILAREHGLPFYVAAPTSTIDLSLPSGEHIPIEERDPAEVTHLAGVPVAPEGIGVFNPAFDVTPHRYITAIITERGVVRAPYAAGLRRLCGPGE
ncbi:MAG: S-methyl-5-thioribose-1-phosphate isomerase [Chloroflexi bacterium]|nr:S-methyl-5-thioribose-1-phosphate isomerase [Chloroflexota bacterium]